MQQLPLLLEHRRLLGREDFLVASANMEAVEWIDAYPDWGDVMAVVVVGDEGAGKTHISWLFSEKTGSRVYDVAEIAGELFSDIVPMNSALVIDNVDRAIGDMMLEENLFHIINYAVECNTRLFLTSGRRFLELNFALNDLKTRLVSFPVANLYEPDDEFLKALLVKQFLERDMIVAPGVVEYIVRHIPRNTRAVKHIVEEADVLSIEEQHRVTIPFIKKIVDKIPD